MACSTDCIRSGVAVLTLCIAVSSAAAARAAEPLRLAVFPSASSDSRRVETAAALDSTVFASISALPQVKVVARPALDLPATEIALGCTGKSRECLSIVLREAGAQGLIASSVEGEGAETMVKLTYFAADGDEQVRTVVRRYPGKDFEQRAFDAVPEMLRELLRMPPRVGNASDRAVVAAAAPAASASPVAFAPERRVPATPIVLAAAGVVLIGVGAGLGFAARASEDEYGHVEPGTMVEIDRALGRLRSAQDQARLANIGFGVGAAALAAGAVWLAIDLSRSPDRGEAVVAASAGPDHAGLVLRGRVGSRAW